MFKTTQAMYDYWTRLRGDAACPSRMAVDPRDITPFLAETFLLSVDDGLQLPYRLAGSRVCGLFGHELKDQSFSGHFATEHRESLLRLVRSLVADSASALVYARGALADGRTIALEILLLPISAPDGSLSRILGTISSTGHMLAHEGNPVGHFSIYAMQMLSINGARIAPSPSLAPEMLAEAMRGDQRPNHLRLVVSR